jgi:RNA 2',3'-cyclic 3'-phosphodiesterase
LGNALEVVDDVRMRLYAAIVPPESARAELAELVRSVGPGTRELTPVTVADMRMPVTNFGNVALQDADTLLQTLRNESARWTRPELRFHGHAALEWEGDKCVWSKLDGDVEDLLTVGREVPKVVQPLGFLVDRRKFRPWLAVGSITDATTLPYLERLTAALDEFKGTLWTLETLTVFRKVPVDANGSDELVLEEIPLGKP